MIFANTDHFTWFPTARGTRHFTWFLYKVFFFNARFWQTPWPQSNIEMGEGGEKTHGNRWQLRFMATGVNTDATLKWGRWGQKTHGGNQANGSLPE